MGNLFQYVSIDQAIVLLFLLSTLFIGIVAGRNIKDIKDYAIANKAYGVPVLVLTLMATEFGGESTTGNVAQIFADGIIYALANGAGMFISLILIAVFIAPKFDKRFEGMLSISDMIKYFYGQNAEKYSGILGYIQCTALFAVQLIVMGHLAAEFLKIDYLYAVMITGILVIFYSTFGGIRSVAITDVFQFAVLIVVVPVIASVATNDAGGLIKIFNEVSIASHGKIFGHHKFGEYLALLLFISLPFYAMYPPFVQRYLMAQNPKQVAKITYILAFLVVALMLIMVCIAFSALVLFSDIEPKAIIPTIINNLLPPGIKGLALAGMLAVVMSSADSALNSAGILIARNVSSEKFFKSEKGKLNFMKLCTLITGLFSMVIAMQNYNIVSIVIITSTLFIPVGVSLILGVLKFKVNKYCFWVGAINSIFTFAFSHAYGVAEFIVPIICTFIALFSFLITCFITNKGSILMNSAIKNVDVKKESLFNIYQYLPSPHNILKYCTIKAKKVEADYLVFGIFCSINYVVPFFMWTLTAPVHYPIMLSLRSIAGFLCVGLLLKDYWPEYLKKYFPVYWHFTLMFCLSFVTTVMFLLMNADTEWLINLSLAIMLLTMLVDWMSFIFISLLGVVLGYIFYTSLIGAPSINTDFRNMYMFTYVCIFSTLIGTIFARRKEATADEKLEVMQLLGGTMAHEVISPMSTIDMSVDLINTIREHAIKKVSKDKALTTLTLNVKEFEELDRALNSLKKTSAKGIKTVEHILTSIKGKVVAEDMGIHNLSECIKEVIEENCTEQQQKQINYVIKKDAIFYGSYAYLKHVFINLFKNAFKYGGKGVKIEIKLKDNVLTFRDSGKGISEEMLPKIFDRFFTSSSTGTGIGLSFCKMVMEDMGGSIECRSELNKYTEFLLVFPKVTN